MKKEIADRQQLRATGECVPAQEAQSVSSSRMKHRNRLVRATGSRSPARSSTGSARIVSAFSQTALGSNGSTSVKLTTAL